MGVRSEIEIPAERAGLRAERESTAGDHALDRRSSQKIRADLGQDLRADPREDLAGDRQQRRNPFEGLKLGRGAAAESREPDRAGEDGPQIDRQGPQQAEKQRRGMFAGLKLNARPAPSQERSERPEREGSLRPAPAPDRLAERARGSSPLEQAVDRYSRAYQSIDQHRREGLPVLDMQRQEMQQAGQQLDQVRDGLKDLMRSTLQYDPATARAMTELSGRERVAQVIDGMKRENAALQDPNVRAERFVERWQDLKAQRHELRGWQHDQARGKVEGQMQGLAKSLERDPQVESILRNRRQELGIGQQIRQNEGISRELEQSITRGRTLGLGR
jgi:hypothetical protein